MVWQEAVWDEGIGLRKDGRVVHDYVVVDPDHEAFGRVFLAVFPSYRAAGWAGTDAGCWEVESHYFANNGCCKGKGVDEFRVRFEALSGEIGVGSKNTFMLCADFFKDLRMAGEFVEGVLEGISEEERGKVFGLLLEQMKMCRGRRR